MTTDSAPLSYHLRRDIHERPIVAWDLADLFLGKLIHRGLSRWVFEHAHDPKLVVKVELDDGRHFQNALEWRTWQTVKGTHLERWFAPCEAISQHGLILLQHRVELRPVSAYPKKIPRFFGDTKFSNYGFIGRRFVACDYAFNVDVQTIAAQMSLKKVIWWGGRPETKVILGSGE